MLNRRRPPLAELLLQQIGRQNVVKEARVFSVSTGGPLDMNNERTRGVAPLLKDLKIPKAGYHAIRISPSR